MNYCLNGIFYKSKNRNLRKSLLKFNNDSLDNGNISFFTSQNLKDNFEKIRKGCFAAHSVFIISNASIYNRSELLTKIETKNIGHSDSEIILRLYQRYGHEIVHIIDGDYSFVIWDEKKQELFCCRSKTGRIPLYYFDTSEYIIFSTLLKSFFQYFGIDLLLNDQYIADYLTIKGVKHEIDPQLTIYKGIKQIPPGYYLSITENKKRLQQYWKPERTHEIILKNDNEYESALVEVLNKATKKRVANYENVGLLLSGGFDSGAVAGLSCKNFIKNGKKLSTFTSIPFADYQDWLSEKQNANEESYVREYQNLYDNIEQFFLPCEGKTPYSDIDAYIKIFEQPYKFQGNSTWLVESAKKANQQNIELLLTGQMGNGTISLGSFYPYLNSLNSQHKYKELLKEISHYANLKKIKSSSVLIRFLVNKFPKKVRKILFNLFKKIRISSEYIPVNKIIIDLNIQKKRFKHFNWDNDAITAFDLYSQQQRLLSLNTFSHNGPVFAKLGLKYNVLISDPTEDVDVIEFCLNLPENQFVRNGVERRLVKRAMKGYIPDKILNANVRGKQSADWVQRIKPDWPIIKEELLSIGDFQLEKKYLDRNIIQKNLDMLKDFDFIRSDNVHMRILFRTLIFSRFLRMIEKGTLFE